MWLVNTKKIWLKEYFDSKVPPYVILSHTWDDQEVLLQDMQAPELNIALYPRKKEGFEKIVSSCAQAKKDRHQYIWIDTCYIDKKSSVELSETINSMFRYYQNATMCYVFFSDVSNKVDLGTNGEQQSIRTRRGLPRQGFRHVRENDTATEYRDINFHKSR
jgi:Heterokaryon incompatibility protein (HET)